MMLRVLQRRSMRAKFLLGNNLAGGKRFCVDSLPSSGLVSGFHCGPKFDAPLSTRSIAGTPYDRCDKKSSFWWRWLSSPRPEKKEGWLERVLGKKATEAPQGFTNRWSLVPLAFAVHMCIGAPWAWSIMSGPVSRLDGFVTSSADDFTFAQAGFPMGLAFGTVGLAAALGGAWQYRVGVRKALAVGATCFGGGLTLSALALALHNLPLLYASFGLLGGIGIGLAYTPPIQTLLKWFPDRPGVASGLTICGFGSGALVFGPLCTFLMKTFARMPHYLGPTDAVQTVTENGRLYSQVDGQLREVVTANAADLSKLLHSELAEGVYLVGSGCNGAPMALGVCGVGYFAVMMAAAFAMKTPHETYKVVGWTPPKELSSSIDGGVPPHLHVSMQQVLRTPQFYLLCSTLWFTACGGMGLMTVAKPLMAEVFTSSLPAIVTTTFASNYVLMLAAGNLGGRIGWAQFFDRFGAKATFNMFTLLSIPAYASLPFMISRVVDNHEVLPLFCFMGLTITTISFMGGFFSTLPAFEKVLFGEHHVGAIHGRVLLSSSIAALFGPALLFKLRSVSHARAIDGLVVTVSPAEFEAAFGGPKEQLAELVEGNTVTINKLMEVVPPGTLDPSPFMYNSTFYVLASFMGAAALSQMLILPVAKHHFSKVR